ncbi:MAG: hypothetical protein V1672_04710 [Candidatus Diapherotrites archaeon]
MGLRDFVRSAVKNTPPRIVNTTQGMTKMIGDDNQPTGSLASAKNTSWEECKHLKKTTNHSLCTKFSAFCAKERCPKKYMR